MTKKYRVWTNGSQYRVERLEYVSYFFGKKERWAGLDHCNQWDYWYANKEGNWRIFETKKEVEEFIKRNTWKIAQEIVI